MSLPDTVFATFFNLFKSWKDRSALWCSERLHILLKLDDGIVSMYYSLPFSITQITDIPSSPENIFTQNEAIEMRQTTIF